MRFNRAAALGLLVPALAFGVAACGDDDSAGGGGGGGGDGTAVTGTTLTIYSSLPLQGTSRGQSEAVINGERPAGPGQRECDAGSNYWLGMMPLLVDRWSD